MVNNALVPISKPATCGISNTAHSLTNYADGLLENNRYGAFDTNDGRFSEFQAYPRIHPRFGILKDEEGNFLLLAKDKALADKLIGDMNTWKTSLGEAPKPVNFKDKEWNGYFIYNISDNLPKIAVKNVDKVSSSLNSNCWGLSCNVSGIKAATTNTNDVEINFWLKSPLAKPIPESNLKPGDLIVYRDGSSEVHTAIYVSKDLVMTKNGYSPVQLQDIAEMHRIYRKTGKAEYFRMDSIKNYITQNQKMIDPLTIKQVSEVDQLEQSAAEATSHDYVHDGNIRTEKQVSAETISQCKEIQISIIVTNFLKQYLLHYLIKL